MISAKSSKKLSTLAIALTLPLTCTLNAYAYTPANEMRDLSSNHWAYKAIEALVEKYGVMTGYPDKTFKGSRSITRYEMAAALYKVMTKVEELIARADRGGVSETRNMSGSSAVSNEDLETLKALQQEFRSELAELRGRLDRVEQKVNLFNSVKIGGKVEVKYRDRFAVTDPTKQGSPLFGIPLVDSDNGINLFNDPVRNLITEFDRTPFRVKTTFDISASLTPGVRFYGSFVADDGTVFKLGNLDGQAIGGHFFDEGITGTSLYTTRSIISIRNNFEDEVLPNAEQQNIEMQGMSGDDYYHERKPGTGLAIGFMNFRNIARPGTKFKNHFNAEKWVGHGYGLLGFGSDDITVRSQETEIDGTMVPVRNSVSRFWATGIDVSTVDPDSLRYNNVPSPSLAFDTTVGPLTFVVGANAGSPYVNRLAALNNNLGAGEIVVTNTPLEITPAAPAPADNAGGNANEAAEQGENAAAGQGAAVQPNQLAQAFNLQSSPTGILLGSDSEEKIINEKVVVGSKDPITPWTTTNLLPMPSEYGDGYGLLGVDLDLGFMRFAAYSSDYWLDSFFSLSGTRKSVSGVLDIGTNALGITLQANYNGIGLDRYSAGLFMNDLSGSGIDFGVGLKTATRGLFDLSQTTGTNLGMYIATPSFAGGIPSFLLALRQTFGDNFGGPSDQDGVKLQRVSSFKDSGLTLSTTFVNVMNSNLNIDLEYNGLIEGPVWGFNFMAHDLGVFTTYNF